MGHGQCRQNGDAQVEQGQAGRRGYGKYEGHEHHKAGPIEHGEADEKSREGHCPLDAFDAREADERLGDLLCRAAAGDQFAEHGAEAKDDDEGAHDAADAFLDGGGDVVDIEAGGEAEADADQHERDKGVEAAPDDEEDETTDKQKGKQ